MAPEDSLDRLSSQQLHDLAVHRATHHVDVKFFWDLLKTMPAAEVSVGEMGDAQADLTTLTAHVNDVTEAGHGELADALRPFYLDYLRRHNVEG